MKCTKCGYVSFDYLSDCKQCGTNLAPAREGLGFGAAKPAVPSLLGSLLRDQYVEPHENVATEEAESSFSLDFGEEFEPGGTDEGSGHEPSARMDASRANADFKPEDEFEFDPAKTQIQFAFDEPAVPTPDIAAGTALKPEPASGAMPESADTEDFSLLDLTDEELDSLIEEGDLEETSPGPDQSSGTAGAAGDQQSWRPKAEPPLRMEEAAGDLDLDLDLDKESISSMPGPFTPKSSSGPFPELDEKSLPGKLEPDKKPLPGKPGLDEGSFLGKPEPDKDESAAAPAVEPGRVVVDDDDNFEISLSEKDLESLLAELESTPEKKEK